MSQLTMIKFAELSGYSLSFIKAIAKQHGSWRSLKEIVAHRGGLNCKFGLAGFISKDECVTFYKDHKSTIKNLINLSGRSNQPYQAHNYGFDDARDKLDDFGHLNSWNYRNFESVMGSTDSDYDVMYVFALWLIIMDIGSKIKTYTTGGI